MCELIIIIEIVLIFVLIFQLLYFFSYSDTCHTQYNDLENFNVNNTLKKNKTFVKNNVNANDLLTNIKNTTPTLPIARATNRAGLYSERIKMLDDPLFSNVGLYNNDANPYVVGEESGLEKCLYYCNGNCVEFGISGISFCFPQ